jgi:signal transduction histidine kinase
MIENTERPLAEILSEIAELRSRLEEAQDTLRAIGSGQVDAFVVPGAEGEQVYTLQGPEHPYRILVETMNEGAATLSADGTILFCNNRLAAMLEVPLPSLLGTRLGSYLSPACRHLFAAMLEQCTPRCANDEVALITGGGNSVPVLISICTVGLSDSQGKSVVVTDLTQQKRDEELMASGRLAHSIIEQAGEAIVVCDEQGRIIKASLLADQLCGKNPLLKPFSEMFQFRSMESQAPFCLLPSSNEVRLENLEVEFTRYDQQVFHLIINATPLVNAQNHMIGCVVTLTDFTRQKRAEEALSRLNAELENRVEQRTAELREKDQLLLLQSRQAAMGEMIGNIAHQWRQPLNLLGLTIQQFLLFFDLDQFDRKFVSQSVSKSMDLIEHMSRTIDDFRNYFKPDKVKVDFSVKDTVTGTLSLIRGSLQTPRIEVEMIAEHDPIINGYPNEFAQVLINILINARDALAERESKNPKVTIRISSEEEATVVTVADNAGGVPESIIDKIFDPYFSTKGPQLGTGVGLFMSKSIIERNMGGRLGVRNTAEGAEFRIEV